MIKYLLLGSAPYVTEYYEKRKERYRDWLKLAVNNAWKVCYPDISEWFIADDFLKPSPNTGIHSGTLIPDREQKENICITPMPIVRIPGYVNKTGSCMILNVMYILYNRFRTSKERFMLSVMGSDFIYDKNNPAFYGTAKENSAVQALLKFNNPDYAGIQADPLRFGDKWLTDELNNIMIIYGNKGYPLFKDTPYESRLPFGDIR